MGDFLKKLKSKFSKKESKRERNEVNEVSTAPLNGRNREFEDICTTLEQERVTSPCHNSAFHKKHRRARRSVANGENLDEASDSDDLEVTSTWISPNSKVFNRTGRSRRSSRSRWDEEDLREQNRELKLKLATKEVQLSNKENQLHFQNMLLNQSERACKAYRDRYYDTRRQKHSLQQQVFQRTPCIPSTLNPLSFANMTQQYVMTPVYPPAPQFQQPPQVQQVHFPPSTSQQTRLNSTCQPPLNNSFFSGHVNQPTQQFPSTSQTFNPPTTWQFPRHDLTQVISQPVKSTTVTQSLKLDNNLCQSTPKQDESLSFGLNNSLFDSPLVQQGQRTSQTNNSLDDIINGRSLFDGINWRNELNDEEDSIKHFNRRESEGGDSEDESKEIPREKKEEVDELNSEHEQLIASGLPVRDDGYQTEEI